MIKIDNVQVAIEHDKSSNASGEYAFKRTKELIETALSHVLTAHKASLKI